MRINAPAKINWTLDVLGRRPDGYHQLDTLMQQISLCDEVLLEPAGAFSLRCDDPAVPVDETNTALRAARLYFEAAGLGGGVCLHLNKRIPSEAGLGGGSADAAAVLRGLNWLYGAYSEETLFRMALSVGADVPFCLAGGLRRCGGVGEEMAPLSPGARFFLVLAKGIKGVSTGGLFRSLSLDSLFHPDTAGAAAALESGDPAVLSSHLGNSLEGPACRICPEISTTLALLRQSGALAASMTGSGSACFGLYADESSARAALPLLSSVPFAVLCHTL